MTKPGAFRKILLAGTSLVAVTAGAAIIWAVFFFPDNYARDKLTSSVSGRTGREFSINGDFDIDWHWKAPRIHAEQIRITNPEGIEEPYILDIAMIDLRLHVWKLLAGKIEIPELTIVKPNIYLEQTDAKTNNWNFSASPEGAALKAATPDERGEMPVIGLLRVKEGKVTYKHAPRGIDATLDMDTAEGQEGGDTFTFKGKGSIEGQPFTIEAQGGSLELLHDTKKEFPLAFTLRAGDTVFSVDGTFQDPIRMTGLKTKLHLSGSNLADLFYILHVPLPPTPAYKLDGQLDKEADVWTFQPFAGTVGGSDLSGDVTYDDSGERPLLKGRLFSKRLDVADLGGFIGLPPRKDAQVKENNKVLPDTAIDLKRLRTGDMDLTLQAGQLIAPGWPLSDMTTHIRVDGGRIALKPLRFGVAEGRVDGFLEMDGTKDVPEVSISLQLEKLRLKSFFKGSSFDEFSEGAFDGFIQLAGDGKSLSQVLGGSEGRVAVVIPGGKISLKLIEASDIDIAQLTPLLLGKDKTTAIRCGVGDFIVRDGLLTSRVFILDTVDTNLKGDAKISLKDESLNISLDAQPKDKSILALQSKILVLGTMANPKVTIDPLSAGARGAGAALLSVLTPAAAILPFIEFGEGKDSDCGALIASTKAPVKETRK